MRKLTKKVFEKKAQVSHYNWLLVLFIYSKSCTKCHPYSLFFPYRTMTVRCLPPLSRFISLLPFPLPPSPYVHHHNPVTPFFSPTLTIVPPANTLLLPLETPLALLTPVQQPPCTASYNNIVWGMERACVRQWNCQQQI